VEEAVLAREADTLRRSLEALRFVARAAAVGNCAEAAQHFPEVDTALLLLGGPDRAGAVAAAGGGPPARPEQHVAKARAARAATAAAAGMPEAEREMWEAIAEADERDESRPSPPPLNYFARDAAGGGGEEDGGGGGRWRRPHPGVGAWHDAEDRVAVPQFLGDCGPDISSRAVGRLREAVAACMRYRDAAVGLTMDAGRRCWAFAKRIPCRFWHNLRVHSLSSPPTATLDSVRIICLPQPSQIAFVSMSLARKASPLHRALSLPLSLALFRPGHNPASPPLPPFGSNITLPHVTL
jgi:hypothetical protein